MHEFEVGLRYLGALHSYSWLTFIEESKKLTVYTGSKVVTQMTVISSQNYKNKRLCELILS